jgi:hypothetical protein
MTDQIHYEWDCEELDGPDSDDAEIIDHWFGDTFAEVRKHASHLEHYRFVLVRNRGNELEGLLDRQWAYLNESGHLPERFDWGGGETGGAKVPARFHKETAR